MFGCLINILNGIRNLTLLTWSNHSTTGEQYAFLRDYKPRINPSGCPKYIFTELYIYLTFPEHFSDRSIYSSSADDNVGWFSLYKDWKTNTSPPWKLSLLLERLHPGICTSSKLFPPCNSLKKNNQCVMILINFILHY